MISTFKVLVSGIDVTEYIVSSQMNENMNRLYHIASLQSGKRFVTNATVEVTQGDKHFTGFIYAVSQNSKNSYTIECRSHSAKLTTPYFSSSDYALEEATTSHALCTLYETKYGIPILMSAIDLDFNGNYERRGTPLDALANIANITGAEFWFDGTSIHIAPNKPITNMGYALSDADVFDFVPSFDTVFQNGIGKITIGTTSNTSTIDTNVSCSAEVDRCSGETIARVIPHDAFVSASGIELSEVKTPMLHQGILSPSFSISMEAEIVSVLSVHINGEEITDYSFLVDTLFFNVEKRGIIMVNYVGYGYRGYANITRAGVERYAEFDILYGACEKYSFQDTMSCDSEDGYSVCGGVSTITPKEMNYAKGFTFYTAGGDPSFSFYSDTKQLTKAVQTLHKDLDWVEPATLSMEAGGIIRHKTRFLAKGITEVRAGGADITANTTLNGEYIHFDAIYLGVIVSYLMEGREHYVNFGENYPNEDIRMIVSGDVQGGCEYSLSGYSQDSTGATVCVEGVTVPINMIEELGVKPFEAVRRSVGVTAPSGITSVIATDNFGILKIPDVIFGEYLLDVNNIRRNSKMKLLAGGSA